MIETRRLHWQSIPISRFKKSVFATRIFRSDNELANLNFELVKKHFVKITPEIGSPAKTLEAPTAVSTPVATAARPTAKSVLDTRRIQQIEIFLNGNKSINISNVVILMKSGETDGNVAKSIELLESLLSVYPTEEECLLLASHGFPPPLALPKADAFLTDLMGIPQFKLAANSVILLLSCEDALEEIESYILKFIEFFKSVLKSEAVVKLLTLVGRLVVYLSNGKKASFNGFSLDMVSQLRKVNSFINKE